MSNTGPMTEATFYILLALTKPGHGYGMMQRIKELSGGRIRMGPGTMYGVLTRMNREGLIKLTDDDGRRKSYTITDEGRKLLLAEYERLKQMVADGKILEEEKE
ncbi:MAG: helix-turn-helix transcriptional regulator [Oscillospiraceae bacterium]|nr:helix-turn-helix transcriptional regulator [Oscillospiraceae bacterium]MBQ3242557.1 helix-turn-helix transcriptional regulator [Oscillospiraceae bacterium]MBR2637162.1 helix-turn-helix transcriptional regulator [Oscillospiraceae bacterium]MBR6607118.1 helix-turn-helix transcriptional regulator [Oscillospiraceae bacterium]